MSFSAALKHKAVTAIAVAAWIPAVALGINVLLRYSTTPGRPGTPPVTWPAGAPVERNPNRPALVMFAHPQCPCTRASLGELAILMAHAHGNLDADVFFYRPPAMDSSWVRSDLWQAASAIPGIRVHEDLDATAAKRFGAFTSGQVLLYEPGGRLLFKGGITAFRGHSGDNAGRTIITGMLRSIAENPSFAPPEAPITTPVLGCSLRGE